MSSYVYMKILESQPDRYDRGIAWLSLGQSERVKRRIVDEHVREGSHVLEIGCGTGTLAILAARKGARVVGLDVSPGMLAVARRKVAEAQVEEQIELHEMGVAGMERFGDRCFELVAATLVFSELSGDERAYALGQAHRVLRAGGRLVVADEVRPRGVGRRVLAALVRIPLLVITFALTQTSTRPVADLEELVGRAGFAIARAERSGLGTFLYLVGIKEPG